MTFTAEAELTIAGPIEAVFSRFVDYRRWEEWMPSTFRPMRGPARPLRAGDRLLIRITGLPSFIKVFQVEGPREVCWGGGIPGVLSARHSFLFEAVDDKTTRVRSSEPWTGVATNVPSVAARIKRSAEKVGRSQLEGFERWFSKEYAGFRN
jgi:hypothetical protein